MVWFDWFGLVWFGLFCPKTLSSVSSAVIVNLLSVGRKIVASRYNFGKLCSMAVIALVRISIPISSVHGVDFLFLEFFIAEGVTQALLASNCTSWVSPWPPSSFL